MTGFLLRLIGVAAVVDETLVKSSAFSVKIITECSALFVSVLFFSFVMAYPASGKQRLVGLILGIPALFAANLIRLVIIFVIGMHSRTLFQYAHVYIGQILMMVFVILAAIIWLQSQVDTRTKDSPFPFLIRFIAYSSIPFVIWLYLDESFVFCNFYLIKMILGIFNYQLQIPGEIELYPHTFNTFHLIAFSALTMATNSLSHKEKIKILLVGLSILSLTYFALRLHQALFIDFHHRYAFRPFIALIIINQWILPFILWLAMVHKDLFKHKGIYVCPICGEMKVGIVDHIRAKHGEQMLQRKDVQAQIFGS